MKVVRLSAGEGAEVAAFDELFDGPSRADATERFLRETGHHLLVAYDGDIPVGFVTGVETTHPDKGTEMFLYELSVAEAHRRRGIGRLLVEHLADLARSRGCYGMWVLTDADNRAAIATYSAAAGKLEGEHVMLGWTFEPEADPTT